MREDQKQIACSNCGETMIASKFASPKTCLCNQCKKARKMGQKSLVQAYTSTPEPGRQLQPPVQSPCPQPNQQSAVSPSPVDPTNGWSETIRKLSEHHRISSGTEIDLDVVSADLLKPVDVTIYRNRQVIEADIVDSAGEVHRRLPVHWRVSNNELDYLSVSRIKLYSQCPAKFNEAHMNNVGEDYDDSNIFTWFGTILHDVMETMVSIFDNSGIIPDVTQVFNEAWQKTGMTDFGMYSEGYDLIRDYISRNPLEGGVRTRPIAIEYEWRGKIDDIPFGLKFDKIEELNPHSAIIRDYKTNRQPYTPFELEDDIQLPAYEIVARMIWPQYTEWSTGFELFRFGWQLCPTRTPDDLQKVRDYIHTVWHQILHDREWPEKLNDFCCYCKRRHRCGEYQKYVTEPQRFIDTMISGLTRKNLEELEQERLSINTAYKIIEKRKDELNNMMKNYVTEANRQGQSVVVDGEELYLNAQSRSSYNPWATKQILITHGQGQLLDECMSINKAKLDAAVKTNPALALDLRQRAIIENYSSPYLLKRKYKPKNT